MISGATSRPSWCSSDISVDCTAANMPRSCASTTTRSPVWAPASSRSEPVIAAMPRRSSARSRSRSRSWSTTRRPPRGRVAADAELVPAPAPSHVEGNPGDVEAWTPRPQVGQAGTADRGDLRDRRRRSGSLRARRPRQHGPCAVRRDRGRVARGVTPARRRLGGWSVTDCRDVPGGVGGDASRPARTTPAPRSTQRRWCRARGAR